MAQQKFTIKINPKYDSNEREAIAQEVIDYIVERTLRGKDKNNRNFAPYSGKNAREGKYSKAYVNSLDFKIAGKDKNNLNLKLSSDMLTDLDLLNHRKGSITIGYEDGSESNAKAEGNIKGTYGNKRSVTKGRDFLGVSGNDLRSKVLSNFPLNNNKKRLEQVAAVLKAQQEAREAEIE